MYYVALLYCQFGHNISGVVKICCFAIFFFPHVYTVFALNVHVQGLSLSVHKNAYTRTCVCAVAND